MMKKILVGALILVPVISYAHTHVCANVGKTMELGLFDAIAKDLNVDTSAIQQDKTKVELLDISPVSKVYAELLAKVDYEDALSNGRDMLPLSEYVSSYYDDDAKTITAKYTYLNNKGKKDVFIATSIMNKDECSIRFNGYITLAREF